MRGSSYARGARSLGALTDLSYGLEKRDRRRDSKIEAVHMRLVNKGGKPLVRRVKDSPMEPLGLAV